MTPVRSGKGGVKPLFEYLIKVASDAIHERLYYILARTLNLPQQHVFWAVTPPHEDLVAVAIRFEKEAFFPCSIDTLAQTVKYRRKTYDVPNTADFWRHGVLHRYCGTGDIHQAMVKGNVLFGIDAADCMFHSPYMLIFSWTHSTKGPQGTSLLDRHCRGKTRFSTRLDR